MSISFLKTPTQNFAETFWSLAAFLNRRIPAHPMPQPSWATKPLLSSSEREQLESEYPRNTQSLCPECNKEAVSAVLEGHSSVASFRDNPGLIEATLVEENGRILMRKGCNKHGPYEDVLSIDPAFSKRMNAMHPGKELPCADDHLAHNHGPLSMKVGRGHFLIVDLTNRCNMKCSPCFMDANHAAYVHELSLDDVKRIFQTAQAIKPRREINILLSGGEPTLSPVFLDAIRIAKSFGFHRVHVATNGIRFAEDPSFAQEAKDAGLWGVFLQLDGIGEKDNAHRGVGNLFAIKQRALDYIANAGLKTTLQVTVVNQLNNHCLGEIVQFAALHSRQIHGVVFQPVMFTGRDSDIDTHSRSQRRYTLSHLVHDLESQCGISWQPKRDWFPSALSSLGGHLLDLLAGQSGSISYSNHPENEIVSPMLVNSKTGKWLPLGAFFDVFGFMKDVASIGNRFRSRPVIKTHLALAAAKHYIASSAPEGFGFRELLEVLEGTLNRAGPAALDDSRKTDSERKWNIMNIAGMWFMDAFNYDLSKTAISSTPVGTQEGEIDFGTYNSAGWRQIVEYRHKTASLSEWNKVHGRHAIYTHGRLVQIRESIEQNQALECPELKWPASVPNLADWLRHGTPRPAEV